MAFCAVGAFRHIQRRVPVKEILRPQHETRIIDQHDRPLLRAREMGQAEAMPNHDIFAIDCSVARGITRQPGAARMPVGRIARRPKLIAIELRHPKVFFRKGCAPGDRGPIIRQQQGLAFRAEHMAGGLAQVIFGLA
jgi:hypothetical protein